MSRRLNLERLRGVVETIETIAPEDRLYSLKKLAANNGGSFDVPSACPGTDGQPAYQPGSIWIEAIQVRATAEDVADLAEAWLGEAKELLESATVRTGDQ